MFEATYRMGLSATPSRKDGCEKLFLDAFGPPAVKATLEPMPCDIRTIVYRARQPMRVTFASPQWMKAKLLTNLASLATRNQFLSHKIFTAYEAGRNILGLSDRVDQLHEIKTYLVNMGIPASLVGIYTGAVKKEARKGIHDHARIILATYGLLKEGVSIDRLDCGFELTPRADGTQAVGRIRRRLPHKKKGVWFTVLDEGVPMLEIYHKSRLREFAACGCTIIPLK